MFMASKLVFSSQALASPQQKPVDFNPIEQQIKRGREEQTTAPTATAPANQSNQEAQIQIQNQAQSDQSPTAGQAAPQIIARHRARLNLRYRFYYQRLSRLADKLDQIISGFEQAGYDLEEARQQLGAARTTLEQANAAGNEAVNEFSQIDTDNYQQQRQLALAARDVALESRKLYQETLDLLKETAQIIRTTIETDLQTSPNSN